MDKNNMILVSVDDHMVEPPDLFSGRVPSAYRDLAPKLVTKEEDGTSIWVYNGREAPSFALGTTAGRPKEEWGMDPVSYDDMRRGCWDVHARVRDMDANGQLGALCFPTFPGYAGRFFASNSDPQTSLMMLRAYNDWAVEDWAGAYPGRFIPVGVPPSWDVLALAGEVRRLAAKGCHAISFTENPAFLGFPSVHDDYWDPFWTACCDEGTVVAIHIGSSGRAVETTGSIDVTFTLQPLNIVGCATELLWSPVLRKFPALKIALAEGSTGWVPYFLERVDRHYTQHRAWTGQDFGDKLPSDVFREHFLTCFITDRTGIELRDKIGVNNIAWECDYPHSDGDWPNCPEGLIPQLAGVPDDEIDLITHGNAMRWFSYDPFAVLPRGECTVAALRARATDVDTTFHSPRTLVQRGTDIDVDAFRRKAQARYRGGDNEENRVELTAAGAPNNRPE